MAARILICDMAGQVLTALDGHHGGAHAAAWASATLQAMAARGVEAIAVELFPSEGGGAHRREVHGALHRLRLDLRARSDGAVEIDALHRYPERDDAEVALAPRGSGMGLGARQAARLPEPVRGALRILSAPDYVVGERHAVRVSGRREPAPGVPRTAADRRHARRLARATARSPQ